MMITTAPIRTAFNIPQIRSNQTVSATPARFNLVGNTRSVDQFQLSTLSEYQRGLNQQYLI